MKAMKHIGKIFMSLAIILCCLIGIAVNAQAATIVDSGTCGDNVTWKLDSEGTLTISGSGPMYDYYHDESLWSGYSVRKVVIKNGVTNIGDSAFYYCYKLESVTIPDSVTSIGAQAFRFCYWLESITIPDSVTSIGSLAFWCCDSLTSITIPDSVTNIGQWTFAYCDEVKKFCFRGNAPSFGDDAFAGVEAKVYYPANDTTWKNVQLDYGGDLTWRSYTSFKINTQPTSKMVTAGKTAKFTVKATGTELEYQWQYRTSSSGSWMDVSAASGKTASYSLTAATHHSSNQYRCKITDYSGKSYYTKTVNLYVLGIKNQPATQKVRAGATAKYTVSATGANKTYQWQYRTSSSGSWKNVSGASGKTASYSMTAQIRHNGYQYRCKVSDSAENVVYTKAASLYILSIKTQPTTQKVKTGTTAKFTVSATGANKTYQWQYRTSSSSSWKNVSGASGKTASYSMTAATRHSGYQYRCKVTDSAGNYVYTKVVYLYVLGIKTQPSAQTVKAGATAKFTVSATGANKTYQWQCRTASGEWKNVTAASGKTASYSLVAAARHNGYQYRCKITDSAGNVLYTKTVTLTVK